MALASGSLTLQVTSTLLLRGLLRLYVALDSNLLFCKFLECSSDVARLCCLQVPVLYPFGHGLSYSSFDYQKLRVTRTRNSVDPQTLAVQLRVKNTGEGAGLPDVKFVRLACPV